MAATILVVEDEPAIQELVACNLELAGHRTLRAESAEQAMQMVREELPDLIVLDWMLPGINGMEFALAPSWRQAHPGGAADHAHCKGG